MAFGLKGDGVNDKVTLASSIVLTGAFEIENEFKYTSTQTNQTIWYGLSANSLRINSTTSVLLRLGSTSISRNLISPLSIGDVRIWKVVRDASDVIDLVDENDNTVLTATWGSKPGNITLQGFFIKQTNDFFEGQINTAIVIDAGTEVLNLVNTTGIGSTWPDTSASSNDGTLVNFPTDDSQWVDLGGSGLTITATTTNYSYNAQDSIIDLTGEIALSVATTNYTYTAQDASITTTATVSIDSLLTNYLYTAENADIELVGAIGIEIEVTNYSYTAEQANIALQGQITLTASATNYTYNSLNATIVLQGPITINPKNIIRVSRKSNIIRVKRNSNIIRVR